MKENIIQAIVAEMQRDLDIQQMARLKAVLIKELQNVEITEKQESQKQNQKENAELLGSFLAAKKIEGCSEKTLAYYRHTIEKMLLTVSVSVCHVSTADIRQYLSVYQDSVLKYKQIVHIFLQNKEYLKKNIYLYKAYYMNINKIN